MALLLTLSGLLAGCTSLRAPDDLAVTIDKEPTPAEAMDSPSPSRPNNMAQAQMIPPQNTVEGPASNLPLTGPESSAGTLTQESATTSQPAGKPTTWQGIKRSLSTVLPSGDSTEGAKMVVPDPSEPAPTNQFPLIEAQVREAAEPRPNAPNQQPDEPFHGEMVAKPRGFAPITLNLQDADARQALELLGQDASMNIFVASGVSGTVTANLRGMSSDEALNTILRLCNLVAHREGNSVFVYPPDEFPELDRVWKVIPLNYASAEDVVASINAIKGLLSPVGYVYAFVTGDPTQVNDDDPDTSDNRRTQEAVVVQDAPDHVFRIERYVAELDLAPRQVQIQAYILEVDLKNNLEHGVNFEEIIHLAGNTATLQTIGFADPKATQAFFARIDGKNFDALLEALKTTTDAKTLANPKVTVLNGQMAHIQIGQKLGYRDTTTQTETAATQSVKFLELGVVLDVTPRITADNRVIMTVKPKIADGRIDPISELPEEDTTEVVTNVLLEDGQGMVIGGLIKEKDSDIQGKVPILGNLPYVGLLFQKRQKEAERKEVIIALLPRVLPLAPCPAAVERLEVIRATTPLFHGPMRRCPRPWEPTLRDALPERGDRL